VDFSKRTDDERRVNMTKALKTIMAVMCMGFLFALLPAMADNWDKTTKVTFNTPVALPGVTLPAGTYVFKLVNLPATRHVVQVFNEAQDHLFASILAIPNYRLEPTENSVLNFSERPPNMPQALRAWFYPGDNFGQEFVYPKAEARELAEVARVAVPAAEIKPAETPQELIREPVIAIMPDRKEVEVAKAIETKPAEPIAAVEPAPAIAAPAPELPKTASPVPLMGLLGLSSLGLSALVRAVSKRIS
jgi:hypothetical protein